MALNKQIFVDSFCIEEHGWVFLIAEVGVNLGGDIGVAKKLIDAAVKAKANAVKFQMFKTESLIFANIEKALYQIESTGSSESQYAMLKKLEITREQNRKLKYYCEKKGVLFLTIPFDEASLDDLDELDSLVYKVSSTDLINLPFYVVTSLKVRSVIVLIN